MMRARTPIRRKLFVLILAVTFVVLNLITDVLYGVLDPRIKLK